MKIIMISLWNFRWLFLHFIFGQLNVRYVTATWPSLNGSIVQILGLFNDVENASKPIELAVHSRAMFKAAVLLSQQYNITIEGQFIEWQSAQTGGNAMDALRDLCQAITASNIIGIIGPVLSREANVIAAFAKTVGIPVISYAATDPDLSNRNAYPAFYRTVPSDKAAASAIVKLFIRFNWTSCIIIYQNDAFGSGGAKVISEAFFNNDLVVIKMIVFDITTRLIRGNLKTYLSNSATRIVVLWAESIYTSMILQNALDSDVLGPQFTWILSSIVSLNSFNQTFHHKLIGMFAIEPVTGIVVDASINTTLLNAAYKIWEQYEPESFPGSTKVNYYALFAFDATWSLIQSLQQLCLKTLNTSTSCISFIRSSFCFDRRFIHSDVLFDIVDRIDFLGVSGPIRFSANVTDRINGSYYYAQNVQPSSNGVHFVPVLYYAEPDEWKWYTGANVIVWAGNSLLSPTDRAVLEGMNLRIGVIESPPFTMVNYIIDEFGKNTTKLAGYVPDLIELLRKKMGFIPNIQLVSSNQTYNGLIKAVADDVYDMVIGDVTITSERRESVSFSSSIFDNSLRIVMRTTPDVNVDLLSYLKPFARSLWMIILAASIFASILFCLIERQENEELQNRSLTSLSAMSLWFSIGTIMGYGTDFHVRTAAGRLLTVGLYMLSLVLVASYTANLTSDLTISKSKDIISGINDIKNGKIPFIRIGILVGTSTENYYLTEISGGSRNYYPVKSTQELYDSLLAGITDVSFLDTGVAEYITNNIYCNLTLVGADFDTNLFGIVIPKQWLHEQDLDINILSLRESGSLDNLRVKWFQTKGCSDSTGTSTAMGIETMAGLLLSFGIICILSLVLFMWKKRHYIKNYLFILGYRMKLSFRKKKFLINHI